MGSFLGSYRHVHSCSSRVASGGYVLCTHQRLVLLEERSLVVHRRARRQQFRDGRLRARHRNLVAMVKSSGIGFQPVKISEMSTG